MKATFHQLVAGFLIFCFVAPFSHIHTHEADEHGNAIETCAVDSHESHALENHSAHHQNIDNESEDCELCDLINSRRKEFTFDGYAVTVPFTFYQDFPLPEAASLVTNASTTILGRAPPVC